MPQNLVHFDTWALVRAAAIRGDKLWYEAPMDAASDCPARLVRVVKVYKNGGIRIDPMCNNMTNFTANSGHLYRFRHEPSPDDVVSDYREGREIRPCSREDFRRPGDELAHAATAAREYVATDMVPYANLSSGQCCNLKLDTGHYRVWLCRVAGGVTVERLVAGKWVIFDGSCSARSAIAPPEVG